ncbi:PLP-dependent aminotransferase family protein [Aeromicrobium sp. IC_218]|uniref:aminotransferase-like domain-containing protein n=1 Tax=Aeromicrobium sp. IC_218 TaxID=2545468 RepID=UPI00103DB41E|nr:PLP-dependent aminotransferase family protein [Aeromicrobium sp. IC_218]TCJ00731.1 PLP-dependent aminotransferase family protein [Aeromicrobium sp. IC_218]
MTNSSSGRLVEVLTAWVRDAPAGARLPSTRSLVAEHGVGPATVQQALRALAGRGLVESRPGVGTFVRPRHAPRAVDYSWQIAALGAPRTDLGSLPATMRTGAPDAIALHSGYPDPGLLPERLVRSAFARAARQEAALQRPDATGLSELRAWFAAELAATAPDGVAPPTFKDVLVVPGSQSGLVAVFRSLVPVGGVLLMESPTYWGAILAAKQAGVRAVPVPHGPEGPDVDALARAFAETGARAFYGQPTFANPTGAQWSPTVGQAVLDVVAKHGAFLVEDDWAHDFGIDDDPRPLASLDGDGRVVYLRSLTKSVSPSVRVAAVVARGPVQERVRAVAGAENLYVSGLLQAAALDVVTQPGWTAHRRALRQRLRERRDLLLASLAQHAPAVEVESVPAGGLHAWVRLPDGTDVAALARDCEAHGLLVAPGSGWFVAEPTGAYLRLGFAGPDPGAFGRAARILGERMAAAAP